MMISPKFLISFTSILLTAQNAACEGEKFIDIVSSRIERVLPEWSPALANFMRLETTSYLIVESPLTIVRQVVSENGFTVDTSDVELLKVETRVNSMKFLPAGIKKKFPKLTAIEIFQSGLTHLEREDMRQFGDDLMHANFWKNSLTALEGDLFEFNPNLKHISFVENPLKFIDANLFQKIRTLKVVKEVQFGRTKCIDQGSLNPKREKWNFEKCNDERAKRENQARIQQREGFFNGIYSDTHNTLIAEQSDHQIDQITGLQNQIEQLQRTIENIRKDVKLINERQQATEDSLKTLLR